MNATDFAQIHPYYPNHQKLPDRCNADGTSVSVDLRVDEKKRIAYQVDERNMLYREAKLGAGAAEFGAWKAIQP